ncbi:hypothetical protein PMAC_002502 [Pneumocystis sp. 'macacae']|nr:hypothetical protein PMAC_002502 [Pneumocystis sp. 'macacae']
MKVENFEENDLFFIAEAFSHIRVINLVLEFPKNFYKPGLLKLFNTHSISLEFKGELLTIFLPDETEKDTSIQVNQLDKILSVRLPLSDSSVKTTEEISPWSAVYIDSNSSFCCIFCLSFLLSKDEIKYWRNLPSDNWSDMIDYWICHREKHNILKGFGVDKNYKFVSCPGIAFVGLSYFLVSQENVQNIKVKIIIRCMWIDDIILGLKKYDKISSIDDGFLSYLDTLFHYAMQRSASDKITLKIEENNVFCNSCKMNVGILTENGIKLYKWKLVEKNMKKTISFHIDVFISAQLLSLIEVHANYKFDIYNEETKKCILKIWVFNSDLRITNGLFYGSDININNKYNKFPGTRVMKICYVLIQNSSIESYDNDVVFHPEMIKSMLYSLKESNSLIPESTRQFDSQDYDELINRISEDINNKNLKILEFIEFIGKYLTGNENPKREKAIFLLSRVIESISLETLHSKQIYVITRFFCGCLEDQLFLKEILMGLYSLQKMVFFEDKEATFLCMELFKKFNPENNIQSNRYIVFQIIDELMIKHKKVLKKMGSEFIEGFIKIVGREKDPRNLILIFSIMNTIISDFNITLYAKDIFNLLFCYFPITFKPSLNDVFGVTTENLKLWLKKCISANDELSSYSIPSLIDKYDFSAINTKKDIIDILSFCMETYSPLVIETYVIQIWDMLKNEIFENSDDDLVKKSLDCLFIISKVFSQEILKNSESTLLVKFLTPISNEINIHFEEPDTKTAKNSIKILYSLSSTSKYAFEILFEFCIPNLLSRFEKKDSINTKAAILEFISFILLSGLHVYGSYDKEINEEFPNNSILMKEKNRLFTILSNSLTTPFFSNKYTKAAAIHALLAFSEIHNLLQYNELELIVQYFNDIVLKEENNLKAEALEALIKIAETRPNLILKITFPNFLKLLSEVDSIEMSNNCSLSLNEIILTVLSHLCVEKQLFDIFISYLLNTFDNISINNENIVQGRTLIFTLLLTIRMNFTRKKLDIGSYIDYLLPELFTRVIKSCIHFTENIIMDSKIINIISQITNLIVRCSNLEKQKLFINDLINLFMNRDSNLLFLSKSVMLKEFNPFEKKSNLYQKRTISIFVSGFAGVRKECLPLDLKLNFIKITTNLILESDLEDEQQIFLFKFISLIYNKFDNDIESSYCETLLDKISENNFSKRKIIILYIIWIIKALILKINKYGYMLLDKLINLMNDTYLGEFISYNFEIINTPKQIILPELTSILPLLLQCFSLNDHKLKVSNINILYIIALESSDLIIEHLGSLIPFLLTFATEKHNNDINVQITALKCLSLFPTILKTEFVQPFKGTVIRKLVEVLDDPKRDVRIEATRTKHKVI